PGVASQNRRSTSFCAAASRPGRARAHASDNNSDKSFRINIDLGCGPSPAYGPAYGTCSALLPAERAMAKIMHGPQNTKRPRGATRAAFLVSRPVALTTVVPSQRNHCSGRDARSNAQSQPLNTSEAPWGASLTTQMGHRPWCPFLLWSVSAWML